MVTLKHLSAYLFLLLLLLSLESRSQTISNVSAEQAGNSLIISYSLESSAPCEIDLSFSTDGGKAWTKVIGGVYGDVGKNIVQGVHKIRWEVLESFDNFVDANVKFKVAARMLETIQFGKQTSEVAPESDKTIKIDETQTPDRSKDIPAYLECWAWEDNNLFNDNFSGEESDKAVEFKQWLFNYKPKGNSSSIFRVFATDYQAKYDGFCSPSTKKYTERNELHKAPFIREMALWETDNPQGDRVLIYDMWYELTQKNPNNTEIQTPDKSNDIPAYLECEIWDNEYNSFTVAFPSNSSTKAKEFQDWLFKGKTKDGMSFRTHATYYLTKYDVLCAPSTKDYENKGELHKAPFIREMAEWVPITATTDKKNLFDIWLESFK
jgi:hypothetical protein